MRTLSFGVLFALSSMLNAQSDAAIEIPKESIFPIVTIDAESEHFDDLKPLDALIEGKQIVMLGESGHNFGSDFLLKTRVVKYLAEKHNFNTIAFEGGSFYTMNNPATPMVKDSLFLQKFAQQSMLSVWGYSNEFMPLASYIKDTDMNFVGLEPQLDMAGNYYFLDQFLAYLNENRLSLEEELETAFKTANIAIITHNHQQKEQVVEIIPTLITWLKTIQLKLPTEKPENFSFYENVIDNYITAFNFYKNFDSDDNLKIVENNNLRDAQMFQNLEAFLSANPGEKVLVWAANFHCCKDLSLINYESAPEMYQNTTVLGEHMHKKYGEKLATFAFASGSGEIAFCYEPEASQLDPPTESLPLNFYLNATTDIACFVDFNGIKDKSIAFEADHLVGSHTGQWYNAFDGLFFISNAQRATQVKLD